MKAPEKKQAVKTASPSPITIFWFRRDLRHVDNRGFYEALLSGHPVLPVFIFDSCILDILEDRDDRRVTFIYDTVRSLQERFEETGSSLFTAYGSPLEVWRRILKKWKVGAVYTNHDYEPYAMERDSAVKQLVESEGGQWHSFKDQVILEKDEVLKKDGRPYTVFTPYSRQWKAVVTPGDLAPCPSERHLDKLLPSRPLKRPSLGSLRFQSNAFKPPARILRRNVIRNYHKTRDIPSRDGTTHLGLHLRFGTLSVRHAARAAWDQNDTWIGELIWREFFSMILYHFPHVTRGAFRSEYDAIPWRDDPEMFSRWCQGRTGFPLVDAGMRELLATGTMHNRVRMITASFLAKNCLVDWRRGEAWFARHLLDFELASNNGNWQWAAGCGCDAAPYFRVFNPETQHKKFDADGDYVTAWVPEYGTADYPPPMLDLKATRQRAIATYRKALQTARK